MREIRNQFPILLPDGKISVFELDEETETVFLEKFLRVITTKVVKELTCFYTTVVKSTDCVVHH